MIKKVITLINDNGKDCVGEYLDWMLEQSKYSKEAKYHLMFIQLAFRKLSFGDLDTLCRDWTQLDVKINTRDFTKRYLLIKRLRLYPIYELRYGVSKNTHLRFIFFPFVYNNIQFLIFCFVYTKTLRPPDDKTDMFMEEAYLKYNQIKNNPQKYLKEWLNE